jgi:hypothetical protein
MDVGALLAEAALFDKLGLRAMTSGEPARVAAE